MQERRTTIRIEHRARTQYCPSEDLLPKDGCLLNLSERGTGGLFREKHQAGERITLTLFLPEEHEALTGTGVVRWSDQQAQRGRWYRAGLEWLPFEDTARHRLETFIRSHPQVVSRRKGFSDPSSSSFVRSVVRAGPIWVVVVAVVGLVWGVQLYRHNQQLGAAIHQRNAVINHLEQQAQQLTVELGAANTRFVQTTQAMSQLDQHTRRLEATLDGLAQEVERVQRSYAQADGEREALIQHVLDLEQQKASTERQRSLLESERTRLEQERSRLAQRLSSLPELRLAIHEAIVARRQARRAQWRQFIQGQREAEHQMDTGGNRGYVVREGLPTVNSSTMWIRVHEPDTMAPAIPAASSD